jgi:hypothetical protein
MLYRRPNWAQLIRTGVPPLYVLRPLAGGFTPPNTGDEYPAPDSSNKLQMMRARQLYEQRRIGPQTDLELALARSGRHPAPVQQKPAVPAKSGKEKKNGHRSSQDRH